MRSRERLIEVLRSVNPAIDWTTVEILHDAAKQLAGEGFGPEMLFADLSLTAKHHRSPHIRELAAEALHYLKGEN